jgi:uncharacterized protein (DUF1697 family)
MTRYVALLRGINIAGHNRVAMADLRGLAADMGFEHVETVLQSGNLAFDGRPTAGSRLESLMEKALAKRLGLEIAFFVRTGKEVEAIVSGNPFTDEAKSDPAHLVVACVKTAPNRSQVKALEEAIVGREVFRVSGREMYIVYPDGIGPSRLTTAVIERKLGTQVTARNWNTVLKLAALCAGGR